MQVQSSDFSFILVPDSILFPDSILVPDSWRNICGEENKIISIVFVYKGAKMF